MAQNLLNNVNKLDNSGLTQLLKKNGYDEFEEILREKEIDGETFLKLTEFQITRWKLSGAEKKRLWTCLEKLRTQPQLFFDQKTTEVEKIGAVRRQSFSFEQNNLIKQKLELVINNQNVPENLRANILSKNRSESPKPPPRPPPRSPQISLESSEDYLIMEKPMPKEENFDNYYDDSGYLMASRSVTEVEENEYEPPPTEKKITSYLRNRNPVVKPPQLVERKPMTLPRESVDGRYIDEFEIVSHGDEEELFQDGNDYKPVPNLPKKTTLFVNAKNTSTRLVIPPRNGQGNKSPNSLRKIESLPDIEDDTYEPPPSHVSSFGSRVVTPATIDKRNKSPMNLRSPPVIEGDDTYEPAPNHATLSTSEARPPALPTRNMLIITNRSPMPLRKNHSYENSEILEKLKNNTLTKRLKGLFSRSRDEKFGKIDFSSHIYVNLEEMIELKQSMALERELELEEERREFLNKRSEYLKLQSRPLPLLPHEEMEDSDNESVEADNDSLDEINYTNIEEVEDIEFRNKSDSLAFDLNKALQKRLELKIAKKIPDNEIEESDLPVYGNAPTNKTVQPQRRTDQVTHIVSRSESLKEKPFKLPQPESTNVGNNSEAASKLKHPANYESDSFGKPAERRLPVPPTTLPLFRPELTIHNDEEIEEYDDCIFNLNDEPYYRNTDRKGAKILLQNLADGAFLFRPSKRFFLTLTIKYQKKFFNLGIDRTQKNNIRCCCQGSDMSPEFATIKDFIIYFTTNALTFQHENSIVEMYLNKILPSNVF